MSKKASLPYSAVITSPSGRTLLVEKIRKDHRSRRPKLPSGVIELDYGDGNWAKPAKRASQLIERTLGLGNLTPTAISKFAINGKDRIILAIEAGEEFPDQKGTYAFYKEQLEILAREKLLGRTALACLDQAQSGTMRELTLPDKILPLRVA